MSGSWSFKSTSFMWQSEGIVWGFCLGLNNVWELDFAKCWITKGFAAFLFLLWLLVFFSPNGQLYFFVPTLQWSCVFNWGWMSRNLLFDELICMIEWIEAIPENFSENCMLPFIRFSFSPLACFGRWLLCFVVLESRHLMLG